MTNLMAIQGRRHLFTVMVAMLVLTSVTGWADSITYNASSGPIGSIPGLSAQATFDLTGNMLTVTLLNTSPYDVTVPAEVLTAVLFDVEGDSEMLTPISASVYDYGDTGFVAFWNQFSSSADHTSTDGTHNGDVSVEWAYVDDRGISSTGLGVWGAADRFDTTGDLWSPAAPNGLQYGILPLADNLSSGNTPVTGAQPLIVGGVVFTLQVAEGFSLDDINNVSFQYGTSWDEPNILVPEPATGLLLAAGLVAAALRRRK